MTLNKTKESEAEKKFTDLQEKNKKKKSQILEKRYVFLSGRIYFTGNDGYQNLLVFPPMLNSLILR